MAQRNPTYHGKINFEQNGVTPTRGQGLSQSRTIRLKGGRQLLKKKGLRTGAEVSFKFLDIADKSTKYNYLAELVD